MSLGSNTLRTQHFLERRSKHWSLSSCGFQWFEPWQTAQILLCTQLSQDWKALSQGIRCCYCTNSFPTSSLTTKYEASCRDFWSRLCFHCLLCVALSQSNLGIKSSQLHRKQWLRICTDTAFLDGSWSFLNLPLHVGKQRMTKPSHPRQNSTINSRAWICRGAG